MAKGQKRSNREVRKPKQNKQAIPAPVALKGLLSTSPVAKKKKKG